MKKEDLSKKINDGIQKDSFIGAKDLLDRKKIDNSKISSMRTWNLMAILYEITKNISF